MARVRMEVRRDQTGESGGGKVGDSSKAAMEFYKVGNRCVPKGGAGKEKGPAPKRIFLLDRRSLLMEAH